MQTGVSRGLDVVNELLRHRQEKYPGGKWFELFNRLAEKRDRTGTEAQPGEHLLGYPASLETSPCCSRLLSSVRQDVVTARFSTSFLASMSWILPLQADFWLTDANQLELQPGKES